jgi:hypothetical protein
VTQPRIPGLSPQLQERAGLTHRQAECLSLWNPDPGKRAGGYRSVGMVLGITHGSVKDNIDRALAKIEAAMREEPVAERALVDSVDVDPFA